MFFDVFRGVSWAFGAVRGLGSGAPRADEGAHGLLARRAAPSEAFGRWQGGLGWILAAFKPFEAVFGRFSAWNTAFGLGNDGFRGVFCS